MFVPFPRFTTPTMPLLGLSESEQALIKTLQGKAMHARSEMLLTEAYYLGEQVIQNLRIAVPKELEFLRTLVGWPSMAVDPYVERLEADCFRQASATDGDDYLGGIMDANGFGAEQSVAFTDALSMRCAYWMVGSPAERGGVPLVTVESPLNMSVLWDLRGTTARAAMQEYWDEDGTKRGALVLPNQTVHLATDDKGNWVIADRDEHGFDFVPVTLMANRPRTNNRMGTSEITKPLMSITDAACRTLLGLEVAREIYSVPQRVILGAAEDAFVKSDGSAASAWETYITKTLGLERDENGDLPDIKQFAPYDPSVFTKLIEMYASQASGIVGANPQDMGLYTEGNPASADAVVAQESRRDRRARRMQKQFTPPLIEVAQNAVRFDNGGRLPAEYARLSLDWEPTAMDTPGTTSNAISQEIAVGAVPPTSDVTLKRLGYNRVDRARLEQDRNRTDGRQAARDIAAAARARVESDGGQ